MKANDHIKEFLDYYCFFDRDPGYAVLLKGKWGTGKTWFVNNTLKAFSEKGIKHLYVSLYGINNLGEIENEFFRQLHPVLSSKGMAFTGKLLKGLLKATVKVDLDGDGSSDGSVSSQVPDINLPDYLRNTDGLVLVFDDLERLSMPIEVVMGYINHFVEHQGYKVIIIANEEEIMSHQEDKNANELSYNRIKEKLIGRTFEVSPDFENALWHFINEVSDKDAQEFYACSIDTITELHWMSGYNNLRHLNQTLWDFERLYLCLSGKVKKNKDLMSHLLQCFLVFSFEIKSGSIKAEEIKNLKQSYYSNVASPEETKIEENVYCRFFEKYVGFSIHDLLLEEFIWVDMLDKGIIDSTGINEALEKSKYLMSESKPDWMRLWHAMDLSDEDFEKYLSIVSREFEEMKHAELGVVKHLTGMFLWFSDLGLYGKTKGDILTFSKSYIDKLLSDGKLPVELPKSFERNEHDGWGGLGFHGMTLGEFKEFCEYAKTKQNEFLLGSYPDRCKRLLSLMNDNPKRFFLKLTYSEYEGNSYFKTPILSYIDPVVFVEALIRADPESRQTVCYTFVERYAFPNINEELKPELEWLKQVRKLLEEKQEGLSGKISGVQLDSLLKVRIDVAIKKLEDSNG